MIDATSGVRPVYVIRDDVDRDRELLDERYELESIDGNSTRASLTRVVGLRGDAQ